MNVTLGIMLVSAWLAAGLLSGLWMARRGFDPLWILVALPLGPLFVPVALERVRNRPEANQPHRIVSRPGPRVLVGLDGSAESEHALTEVLRLFGPFCGLLVLAEVVHYEAAEGVVPDGAPDGIAAASDRLSASAARARDFGAVHTEVLVGAPGSALRQFAERHEMDVLVVGRRGRGLSARVLGSVSKDLVEHSSIPVLVIEPAVDSEQQVPGSEVRASLT